MAVKVEITRNGQNVSALEATDAIYDIIHDVVDIRRVGGSSSRVWIVKTDEIRSDINDARMGNGYHVKYLGRA